MKQFVAIIRGINVGGHHKVHMQTLREALEAHKLRDVRTYIQSGNVVFRSLARKTDSLEATFGKVLRTHFGIHVPVIVREEKEWARTVRRNPFLDRTEDHKKLHVTFLRSRPAIQAARALSHMSFPHDEVIVDGKDAYLFCRNGYAQTDLTNAFLEKKLMVKGTTRNWRTVLTLADMLAESDG